MTTEAVRIELRGGNLAAYNAREGEIIVEGGAGTGKTFAILHKLNNLAHDHPGFRGLILRKTAVTLATTCLRTLEDEVYDQWDKGQRRSIRDGVHFFGGSQNEPAGYMYDNGSMLAVGGMDQASKVLSSNWDVIYVNECTELSLEEWETLTTRARLYTIPNNRVIGDCNPSYERHPLYLRARTGQARLIHTVLRDNPAYYDRDGTPTERGEAYIKTLEGLTGTRRQRLLLGQWVGMENAIYPQLDATTMLVPVADRTQWGVGAQGVDFGRVHLSAVVSVSRATTGVVWVRECHVIEGGNLQAIEDACRTQRLLYHTTRGVVDPIQEVLGQRLGYKVAKSGAGSRKGRIQQVTKLLDAGALKFDAYGPGVSDLFAEMAMYRYEIRETDTVIEDVVVRKDDDRVAALEYAIEAMEMPSGLGVPVSRARVYTPPPSRSKARVA